MILPIYSINRFARIIGVPRDLLQKLSDNPQAYYNPFPKRQGRKVRLIDNPVEPLKGVQKRINACILNEIEFPECMIGGIKGRKPDEHPGEHVGRPVVITIDVKDCFPSITNRRIFHLWRYELGCSPGVARLATKLTTVRRCLPLGAPTSTTLANLVLLPCVQHAVRIATGAGYTTSQYVDDQALSGNALDSKLITSLIKGFSRAGFTINRKKVKIMRSGNRQVVTKKHVNKRVTMPPAQRARIRAALHEFQRMKPVNQNYGTAARSVAGRIYNLRCLHPSLAERYLTDYKRMPKPKTKQSQTPTRLSK